MRRDKLNTENYMAARKYIRVLNGISYTSERSKRVGILSCPTRAINFIFPNKRVIFSLFYKYYYKQKACNLCENNILPRRFLTGLQK